ncbi:MAG: protein jag [Candidatus Acidiferrales bacterium]
MRNEPFVREGRLDVPALVAKLRAFLEKIMPLLSVDLRFEIRAAETASESAPAVCVSFSGADEDILLAHNADLLGALEYISHRALRLAPQFHDQVRFDCGDYRATRVEELKLSARVAAQRVRETGQPFIFNPMSSRERRIIHLELNDAPGVRTSSEDMGDRRHLVIYPAPPRK